MDKNYLNNLNQFVIDYYKSRCDKPLSVASNFCCSEMARYIGYKILNEIPGANAYVLKGVISKDLAHDVLLISLENEFTLLGPAVWQFIKDKGDIVMDLCDSVEGSIKSAEKIYGGVWKLSEELQKGTSNIEMPKLKAITDKIINENCKEN
jgi:hypothetical protein